MAKNLKYIEPISSVKNQKVARVVEKCPLCSCADFVKTREIDIDTLIDSWIEKRGYNPIADVYRHKTLVQKKCTNCGLFYYNYHLKDTTQLYDLLSQKNYYPKYREEFGVAGEFIKKLKPQNLLEVGCGCGNFLLFVGSMVSQSYGCETSERAISLCKQKGVKNLIESSTENIDQKFDVVCHFELLEHIFQIKDFLSDNLRLLADGGHLIIGTPNPDGVMAQIDYDILDLPPHHQMLFGKQTLLWIAKTYNLLLEDYKVTSLDEYRYEMFKKTHKKCPDLSSLKASLDGDTHVALFCPKN